MKSAIVAVLVAGAAAGVYNTDSYQPAGYERPAPYETPTYEAPAQEQPTSTPYESESAQPTYESETAQPTYESESAQPTKSESAQPTYPSYGAAPNGTEAAPSYTTEVVTEIKTYCPGPTKITHGGQTYTVTEATTLTITNCPCTVSKPVYTQTTSVCYSCSAAPAPSSEVPVYTTPAASAAPTYAAGNSTAPTYASPSASYTAAPSAFTGAAAHVAGQAGAGLAAVLGLVAYIL